MRARSEVAAKLASPVRASAVRFTTPPKLPISLVPPPVPSPRLLQGILGAPPRIKRIIMGTLTSAPPTRVTEAFREGGFGDMQEALDEICPGACASRAVTRALIRPGVGQELQPKIDDFIARSARVVRAIIAEKGGDGRDFLNWSKDRAKFLVTHGEPYSPPTYEDYLVHKELYS